MNCPFNALHLLLKLVLSLKPTIEPPIFSTALKIADDTLRQFLETLASNPQVLEKFSEALLQALTKQIRTSQNQEGNISAGNSGSMVHHVSDSTDNSRRNEANISGTNSSPNSKANWQGEVAGNSGANNTIGPCGNEANPSSVEANHRGNEAAGNSNVYGAGNSHINYALGGAGFSGSGNSNYYDNTVLWPGSNYYGNDSYYPYFPSPNQLSWNVPFNAQHNWRPGAAGQPAQSINPQQLTQVREAQNPSQLVQLGKWAHEHVDEHDNISEDEVSVEVPSDDESQPTEPATKKKFVPSKELMESLSSYTVRPLKNEGRKKV